jgi:FkbM family methyltransferase
VNPRAILGTLTDLRRHLSLHPLTRDQVGRSMLRFARYQLAWRLARAPTVINWVGGTRLIVGPGMRGVTGEAYLGLNEYADMLFVAHLLRPGDLFVDVGANLGTYSLVAARVAGAHAIAVEPIAATVAQLRDHLRLNDVAALVEVAMTGVSDRPGELWFTNDADALNHVTAADTPGAVRIPVTTLDALLGDRAPLCVKIDVELHEAAVLAGARATLARPSLQAVLIETAPENRTDAIWTAFAAAGFAAHRYDPATRTLTRTDAFGPHNTLFVRDTAVVADRLRTAPPVTLGKRTF